MISRTPQILALLAALTACDPAEGAVSVPRGGRASSSASSNAPAVEAALVPPPRGRLLAGERVERVPVWPPPAAIAASRDRLSPTLLAAIDRSSVPVLVPDDPEWLARASVFTSGPQGPGYALAAAHGDKHLSVQASRVATLLPRVGHHRGKHRIRGVDGFLGENEGIHTATWIEYGVAYSAELECEAPDRPDCEPGQLAALVAGLAYVGGVGAVGGAP